MNSLLSICIPTYNRSDYLKECLQTLIKQVRAYDIPIYVSDNASTDNTITVLQELKKQYSFLMFRQNSQNIGFDCNLFAAVEMASSQYVWSFSDDDIVLSSAICEILKALEEQPEVILLNYQHRSIDFQKIVSNNELGIYQDQILIWDKYDKKILSHFSFVGAVVAKRIYWCASETKSFIGSGFIHTGVAINAASHGKMYVITSILVWLRGGSQSWLLREIEVLYCGWSLMVDKLSVRVSLEDREIIRRTVAIATVSLRNLIRLRIGGGYKSKHFLIIKKEYKGYSKLIALLIALIPERLLKFAHVFCKNIKKLVFR